MVSLQKWEAWRAGDLEGSGCSGFLQAELLVTVQIWE